MSYSKGSWDIEEHKSLKKKKKPLFHFEKLFLNKTIRTRKSYLSPLSYFRGKLGTTIVASGLGVVFNK